MSTLQSLRNFNNKISSPTSPSSPSTSTSSSSPSYQELFFRYSQQYDRTRKQQEDARAQAFYDEELKVSDEKRKIHDDPANLWGGDVGLALARVVAHAQQSRDEKLQSLLMSLEIEMHGQMNAVQEGLDNLKQRLVTNEKEIEEERNLIAGHLSVMTPQMKAQMKLQQQLQLQSHQQQQRDDFGNNNNNQNQRNLFANAAARRDTSSTSMVMMMMATSNNNNNNNNNNDDNNQNQQRPSSTSRPNTADSNSFGPSPITASTSRNNSAFNNNAKPPISSTSKTGATSIPQQVLIQQQLQLNHHREQSLLLHNNQGGKRLLSATSSGLPPTLLSLDKLTHSLHAFPVLIAEALWRELKCESVNIYVRGKDNASSLLYSVPHRQNSSSSSSNNNTNDGGCQSFKRLHRSVETAVFQHQVAVCAWDSANKNNNNVNNFSFQQTGGASTNSLGTSNMNNNNQNNIVSSSSFNTTGTATPHTFAQNNTISSQQSHPQSYVVWPVVLVDSSWNLKNNNNENEDEEVGDADLGGENKKKKPQNSNNNHHDNNPNPNSGFNIKMSLEAQRLKQEQEEKNRQQKHQQGARYKTIACIECVNKKISSYSFLSAALNNSNTAHQQTLNLESSSGLGGVGGGVGGNNNNINHNNNNSGSTSLLLHQQQVKMQFSKTDEALIASAAKLLAACFENFPASASVTDSSASHQAVAQIAKVVASNVQPLAGEQPSVNIPTAVGAIESACMNGPPIRLFRGPAAGVFKPTIGHQTSDKIPSSPYALANSTKESKTMTIDSFTHDGNLRSLEASISYLDSMWKAAFADNVGMHEECRKLSTKIRDLSFICSQVEECFAAARKMDSIDDIRSFLRTAELSLKSGSRALLGTAMKISLESQINNNGEDAKNNNGKINSPRKNQQNVAGGNDINTTSNNNTRPRRKSETFYRNSSEMENNNSNKKNSHNASSAATIAISDIHIDGPDGLRHYTVDPESKRAQMQAIEKTVMEAIAEAKRNSGYNNNNEGENNGGGGGGHQWLRHHHHQVGNNNNNSNSPNSARNIATPKSLQKFLPKVPAMPQK